MKKLQFREFLLYSKISKKFHTSRKEIVIFEHFFSTFSGKLYFFGKKIIFILNLKQYLSLNSDIILLAMDKKVIIKK